MEFREIGKRAKMAKRDGAVCTIGQIFECVDSGCPLRPRDVASLSRPMTARLAFQRFAFCSMCAFVSSASMSSQNTTATLRFLENSDAHQWCRYGDESVWKADVDLARAIRVGGLMYSKGKLTEIAFTQTAESGDWTAFDRYLIGQDGQPEKLERSISVLPGDRKIRSVYSFNDGKPMRLSISIETLSTGKPAAIGVSYVPPIPIVGRVRNFPFWRLIDAEFPKQIGKICR